MYELRIILLTIICVTYMCMIVYGFSLEDKEKNLFSLGLVLGSILVVLLFIISPWTFR